MIHIVRNLKDFLITDIFQYYIQNFVTQDNAIEQFLM
jgi:hypothetical protein